MNIKEKEAVLKQIIERELLLPIIYDSLLNIKELELIDKIRLSAIYPEPLLKSLCGKFQLKAGSIMAPAAWFFKVCNQECEQKHIRKDDGWAIQLITSIENNYPDLLHDEELHKNLKKTSFIPSPYKGNSPSGTELNPPSPYICFSDAKNRSTVMKMLEQGQSLEEVTSWLLDKTSDWYDKKEWAKEQSENMEFGPNKREVYRIKKAEVEDLIKSLIELHNDLPRLSQEIGTLVSRKENDKVSNTTDSSSMEKTSTIQEGNQIRQPENPQEPVCDFPFFADEPTQSIQ